MAVDDDERRSIVGRGATTDLEIRNVRCAPDMTGVVLLSSSDVNEKVRCLAPEQLAKLLRIVVIRIV